MTSCVVVAAGEGTRFKSRIPKILYPLQGIPVLEYSLKTFSQCHLIDEIVLVINEKHRTHYCKMELTKKYPKIKNIVNGGSCREESVFNGFSKCSTISDTILIHDGARPFVTDRLIQAIIEAVNKYGACVPCYPVNGSVKIVRSGKLVCTIFEKDLEVAQTPQGFRREILEKVFSINKDRLSDYPDESSMCEKAGYYVKVIPGEITNIKITTRDDIKIASSLLCSGFTGT